MIFRRRTPILVGSLIMVLVAAVCQGALGYTQYLSGVPAGLVAATEKRYARPAVRPVTTCDVPVPVVIVASAVWSRPPS